MKECSEVLVQNAIDEISKDQNVSSAELVLTKLTVEMEETRTPRLVGGLSAMRRHLTFHLFVGYQMANVLPFAQIISLSAHRLYCQLLGRQIQTKIKVVTESTDRINPYPYTRRQYLHYSQHSCRN